MVLWSDVHSGYMRWFVVKIGERWCSLRISGTKKPVTIFVTVYRSPMSFTVTTFRERFCNQGGQHLYLSLPAPAIQIPIWECVQGSSFVILSKYIS
jgi:hypothetical protein